MTKNIKPIQRGDRSTLFLILITAGIFWAAMLYFMFKPIPITIQTVPIGANVTVNARPLCSTTPCSVSLNRFPPKRLIIGKATYFDHVIYLPQFGTGWGAVLENDIVLKPWVSAQDKLAGTKKCRGERERADDPLNVKAEPCYRIVPPMPRQATKSGHCHVVFNVSKKGKTENIRTKGCTESIFQSPAMNVVVLWEYLPKIENGKKVLQKDLESKIIFKLTNEKGEYVPPASYFEKYPDHTHDIAVHESFEKNK